jgi:hypothetical protein
LRVGATKNNIFGKETKDDDLNPSDNDMNNVNRNQNLPEEHNTTPAERNDPNMLQVSDDGSMSYWTSMFVGSH